MGRIVELESVRMIENIKKNRGKWIEVKKNEKGG